MEIHPLKAFRENQTPPLKQDQLAAMLGVAKATVSRWETGTRKIDEKKLPKIQQITSIPVRELRPDLADLMGERQC